MRTVGGSLSVSLLPRFLMYAGHEVTETPVYCCRPSVTFLVCLHYYVFPCNRPKRQERVYGKRSTEILVQSFNTRRVEYTGYPAVNYTRVGTLIVATIYLQLIQNRYMFPSFTVLQCSHQHCVQPVTRA